MYQENGARFVMGNATAGHASLFRKLICLPSTMTLTRSARGSIHFEANLECTTSAFVAAFSNPEGGVLQVAQGLFGLAPTVLDPVLGHSLTSTQEAMLKKMIPANVAFGLQECIKRCKLKIPSATSTFSVDSMTTARLALDTHITGYAYAAFVASMLLFFSLSHTVQKFGQSRNSRFFRRAHRWLMYAPTIFGPVKKDEKGRDAAVERSTPSSHSKKPWAGISLPPRSDILLICLFWAVNLALALWDVDDESRAYRLFQRIGWLAIWNAIACIILALKVSPLPWLVGKSHDGLVFYHKWIAITAFIEVWIHSILGMFVLKYQYTNHIVQWMIAQTGAWIATPAFTVMVIVAWTPWFAKKHFEAFVVLHVVAYVALLVGLWLHNTLLRWYVVVLIALWLLDRIARVVFLAYLRGVHTQYATLFNSSQSTKVLFQRRQKWSAGSHIYISFPDCKPMQSHPYTIASIVDESKPMQEVALLIQRSSSGSSGFSNKLYELVHRKGQICELPFVYHGPYGAAPNINHFTRVLCIGGGSGITMPYSLTQSFLATPWQNPAACTLVWCTREIADFTAFDLSIMKKVGANIYLYQTRSFKTMGAFQSLLKKLEGVKDGLLPNSVHRGQVTEVENQYDLERANHETRGYQDKSSPEIVTSIQPKEHQVSIDEDDMEKVLQPKTPTYTKYTSDMERAIGLALAEDPSSSSMEDGKGVRSSRARQPTVRETDHISSPSPSPGAEDMIGYTTYTDAEDIKSQRSHLRTVPAHRYYGHKSAPQITGVAARVAAVRANTSFLASEQADHRLQAGTASLNNAEKTAGAQERSSGLEADDIKFSPASAKIVRLQKDFAQIGIGRPAWSAILKTFLAEAVEGDKLCVVVCGSTPMCREVRNAVARCPTSFKIDLHVEQFG